MQKIYIDKNQELTVKRLSKIIQYYMNNVLPELKFSKGYYDGTGQKIMKRYYEDLTKPNNKIVKNYCKSIVDNMRGFICGNPITYAPNEEGLDIQPLLDVLKDNDYTNSDSEWLKNSLIYGWAPQLIYIDENGNKKFKNINPEQVIPIYNADLDEELLYCIYYYPIVDWDSDSWDHRFQVVVYDDTSITTFTADSAFNSLTPVEKSVKHFFGEVPFSIFYLTDDGESIFKCVISLQDAFNTLISDAVNSAEAFCDAYMVLKNAGVDEETLQKMKENRIIELPEDSDAFYLTKNLNDSQVQNLLDDVNTAIHTIANSPDFSSEDFATGVSSGISLQFKLVGFNNIASNIESQFEKAILKRINLLNKVFTLVDMQYFDIDVVFTPNLPTSIADTVDEVNKLRNLVSDRTLLSLLPFITDVDAELERLSEQNSQVSALYDFNIDDEDLDE